MMTTNDGVIYSEISLPIKNQDKRNISSCLVLNYTTKGNRYVVRLDSINKKCLVNAMS